MSRFKNKLPMDFIPDKTICIQIRTRLNSGKLPCATAFRLAEELGINENELGYYADHLDIRLEKCQIGLFGHDKNTKLIKHLDVLDNALEQAVLTAATNGVIRCEQVFDMAKRFGLSLVMVGSACETLGIKIKHCRFGAF
ncbi:MAG: hypothetical protein KKD44_19120 [Proteobacteria bacterium]|nr:hypothetical protein [Pseudomonadota bacterium]